MDYVSAKEMAQRWGVTLRRVQDLCNSGGISGATRFGRAWMIPVDAKKPVDGRTAAAKDTTSSFVPFPRKNPLLLHTDLYHTAGSANQVIEQLAWHPEAQRIFMDQLKYEQGKYEEVFHDVDDFLTSQIGFYSVISAASVVARCAMWKGDVSLWRRARQHIYTAQCQDEHQQKSLEFWLAVTDSAVYDTTSFPAWFTTGNFDCLSADSFGTARLYYVKQLFINATNLAKGRVHFKDVEGLGLMRTLPYFIEPMIAQAKMEKTLIPEIYLHLIGGSVYHTLGQKEKAVEHIDQAISLCLPDELCTCLVEFRNSLGSLLDDRLMMASPVLLNRVKLLHKQVNIGWIQLHNLLLERNVSVHLTLREREIAHLAALGFSNNEISGRLHIQVSSVKRTLFSAMNKVGVNKRSELGLFV